VIVLFQRCIPPRDALPFAIVRPYGCRTATRYRRVCPARPAELRGFDYVIAMDEEILDEIRQLHRMAGGEARVHRLREWDPEADHPDVPDPYYGGPRGFDDVHDIVDRACAALLDHLAAERGLA
jgi:protein-tyrosine-phosphatase